MKKLPLVALSLLVAISLAGAAQNQNANANANANSNGAKNASRSTNANRSPIFRATADQVKQAQAILNQRGFYNDEQAEKLYANTRARLQKHQHTQRPKRTRDHNKPTHAQHGHTPT